MSAPPRWLALRSIVLRLDVPQYWRDAHYRRHLQALVAEGLGGVCLFGGDCEHAAAAVAELVGLAPYPLVVAADLEYGLPMRFEDGVAFLRAFALGRLGQTELTARIAAWIAADARRIGITWNLAPVCDLASQPENPVIGVRAFGETTAQAAPHVAAWVQGTQAQGLWACAKHFPGHGATWVDSHEELPTLPVDGQTLRQREWEPFRTAIGAGVCSVMLGHLHVPALEAQELPASLSPACVAALRQELGYEGVIVTDALDMGAITRHFSTAQAVEAALRAGVDLLLMPADPDEAVAAAEHALECSEELRQRRRQSLSRVHQMRLRVAPAQGSPEPEPPQSQQLAQALASAWRAIELEVPAELLPLTRYRTFAAFALVEQQQSPQATLFFRLLAQHTQQQCEFAYVSAEISPEELARLKAALASPELIVVAFFAAPRVPPRTLRRWAELAAELVGTTPAIAVLLGTPWVPVPQAVRAVMRTYSDTEPSVVAAALRLCGVEPPELSS